MKSIARCGMSVDVDMTITFDSFLSGEAAMVCVYLSTAGSIGIVTTRYLSPFSNGLLKLIAILPAHVSNGTVISFTLWRLTFQRCPYCTLTR